MQQDASTWTNKIMNGGTVTIEITDCVMASPMNPKLLHKLTPNLVAWNCGVP